jgi:ribulose-5-phosphate 4-epimerase/fuculose-1-phosphate aldolase
VSIYLEKVARASPPSPMTDAEWQARVQLAACYRIFDMLGWVEMIFNHITVRVPGSEVRFLINPFGLHYREIKASNLLLIDVDGNPARPADWPVNRAGFVIHSAIHAAIPSAHCVMHTHTTSGMAVACLKEGDKPAVILRNHGLLAWGASIPEAFLMMWTLQRACDVQITASRAGEIHPIQPEVFPQTVRESGPGEKRTCEDVFAALQRKVDSIDPSYRD